MGVPFRLILYAPSRSVANRAAAAARDRVERLDRILSDYDPDSELRRLCETAGSGRRVRVSDELWTVLEHAEQLARQTCGAFDVTVGPFVRLWRRARRQRQLPSEQRLAAARERVGYRLIQMYPATREVLLAQPGMRLDLGGIAKGYALDETLRLVAQFGVRSLLVDAGGDVLVGEPPPDAYAWRVAVAPSGRITKGRPVLVLRVNRAAVATSGSGSQYVEIGGRRYSHIIDPRTGMALVGRMAATVVAPSGIEADALASALCVLGPARGLKLLESYPGAAARVVMADTAGRERVFESARWAELTKVWVAPELAASE
jgi:thiamine biosynthesis lipoprotein